MEKASLRVAVVLAAAHAIGCASEDPAPDPDSNDGEGSETTVRDAGPTGAGGRPDAGNAGGAGDSGRGAVDATVAIQPVDAGQAGACNAGFKQVGDSCACDLNGTFALRYDYDLAWSGLPLVEDGAETTNGWSILQLTYGEDGKLAATWAQCGQTSPELCNSGLPPLLNAEAYAPYRTASSWAGEATPVPAFQLTLTKALPGEAFVTPQVPLLEGIALADPLGEWPKGEAIEGGTQFGGSAVNGAKWVDSDGDDRIGYTTQFVPPGGKVSDALETYGDSSAKCPRANASAPRSPYAYPPTGLLRLKAAHAAQRSVLVFDGTIESCDRISGRITGPDEGKPRMDTRAAGCVMTDGSADSECTETDLAGMEASGGLGFGFGELWQAGRFTIVRATAGITCAQARSLQY